ncbi:MAG: hypothetical protein KF858_11715 [Candidatus Sumerlaeia bacterium]|nr:hypothetical protein [Candidatus Sumerlaeia bacterium]
MEFGYATLTDARFIDNGTKLLTVSRAGIIVWDAATGSELRRLGDRRDFADRVYLSADESRLAARALGGAIRVWSVATGEMVREVVPEGSDSFDFFALSPCGDRLALGVREHGAAASTTRSRLLNVDTGEELSAPPAPGTHFFSPDCQVGVTYPLEAGVVRTWNAATGEPLLDLQSVPAPGGTTMTGSAEFSSDSGSVVLTRLGSSLAPTVWNLTTGTLTSTVSIPSTFAYHDVRLMSDSRTLVMTRETLNPPRVAVLAWDIVDARVVHDFGVESQRQLLVSPDRTRFAWTSSSDWQQFLHAFGELDAPLATYPGNALLAIDAAGSRVLAVLDSVPTIQDYGTGTAISSLPMFQARISQPAIHPEGGEVAALWGNRVVRWDMAGNRLGDMLPPSAHGSNLEGLPPSMLSYAHDGQALVVGLRDGLALMDVASGELVRMVLPEPLPIDGNTTWMFAPLPGGRQVAYVRRNRADQVGVIDIESGAIRPLPPGTFHELRDAHSFSASPDGRYVIASGIMAVHGVPPSSSSVGFNAWDPWTGRLAHSFTHERQSVFSGQFQAAHLPSLDIFFCIAEHTIIEAVLPTLQLHVARTSLTVGGESEDPIALPFTDLKYPVASHGGRHVVVDWQTASSFLFNVESGEVEREFGGVRNARPVLMAPDDTIFLAVIPDEPMYAFATGLPAYVPPATGDVDADGVVTPQDAESIFRCYIEGKCPEGVVPALADLCPADGVITPLDAQFAFGLFLGLGAGCP